MGLNEKFFRSADEDEPFFNTVLYDGTGSSVTVDAGFAPDLVWLKRRDSGDASHTLVDTVRGANSRIFSDTTASELTNGDFSFNSDGTFDTNGVASQSKSGAKHVAWCFKAGGAAVPNTDGDIPSNVSANVANGFSIVKYTGTGNADDVGHGLDSAPDLVIAKNLDSSDSNSNWIAYASPLSGERGIFNGTQSFSASTAHFRADPDSTVLKLSNNASSNVNRSGDDFIAYCFHSVAGVSKLGSFVGTGQAGNAQDIGFEPSWIMFKPTAGLSSWYILDVKRNSFDNYLLANSTATEGSLNLINTTSTGFQFLGSGLNNSGVDILYYAIA